MLRWAARLTEKRDAMIRSIRRRLGLGGEAVGGAGSSGESEKERIGRRRELAGGEGSGERGGEGDGGGFTEAMEKLYNRAVRGRPRDVRPAEASIGKMMLFTSRPAAEPRQDQGMLFKLVEIDGEGRVHVSAEGDMTSADVEKMNPLENVVGARWATSRVLMDMSRVSYIDSMAIGWLINCHKRFKESGGRMVLHSIPLHVKQIFDLLKISTLFPLADGRESACRAANGEGGH
jgi:anti-anti-sigma factor